MPNPTIAVLVLLSVLSAACASTGATPRPFPGAGARSTGGRDPAIRLEPDPATGALPGVGVLLATALHLRGVPYRNGGSDPGGFDCSGFTQYVFAQHGIELPREVRDQFRIGEKVDADGLVLPGDLIFFSTTGSGATHVGLMLAGDQFVHAPSSNGVVRVERLSADYWARRYLGARRIGLPTESDTMPNPDEAASGAVR